MIKLLCVGKIKETYIRQGIAEYEKRLSRLTKFSIVEVSETNTDDDAKNQNLEAIAILGQIKDQDYVITLELEGSIITSEELAAIIDTTQTYTAKDIVFVIGGSTGLAIDVKNRANKRIAFGRVTYPHQLMRLILSEQIYRAYTILGNIKYHK